MLARGLHCAGLSEWRPGSLKILLNNSRCLCLSQARREYPGQTFRRLELLDSKSPAYHLIECKFPYRRLFRKGGERSTVAFSLIGISSFTYVLAVQLPLLKAQDGRTGRTMLQPWINNSLTLNLIVCRKKQLTLKRISLLKRKAPPRGKGAEREGKVKTQKARFIEPGFF